MKKRIIALIVCITMIIGVLPTMSFAATRLYDVGITGLDAPMADATPDYTVGHNDSVFLDSGNNSVLYYKNGICWYDMTTSSTIRTNATFVAGHQYKAVLYVNASDGFEFADEVSVTVNNLPATVSYRFSNELIEVEFVFDAIPAVTSITSMLYYTDSTPKAGNELETVTLVYINNVRNSEVAFSTMIDNWDGSWYVNDTKTDNPSDYEEYTGDVYTAGVAFAYRAEITVPDGYAFTNESIIDLNTTTETLHGKPQSISADKKTAVYYFFLDVLAAQPINSVYYTLNGYELDAPINAITIDSASQVKTDGQYGTDYFITVANRVPIMTGNFKTDTTYTLYIAVKSDTHDVSTLTKNNIYLNGKTVTNTEIVGGVLFAIVYLTPLEIEDIEISNILLAVDTVDPSPGQKFYYPEIYAVNGDENMKSAVETPTLDESFGWYKADYFIPDANYEYVTDTNKFEANKAYLLFTTIYAADGYKFAPDCFVMMSTPDGLKQGELYEIDDSYITYEFYYNLGAPETMPKATSAKVSLSGYTKGKAVDDIDVSLTINGSKGSQTVFDNENLYGMSYGIMDKNEQFILSGTFAYDTDYYLSVIIFSDMYDVSSLKKSDITLNGRAADKIIVLEKQIVSLFKLPKLTKPIANPFKDVKKDAYYYDSVLWAVSNNITSGTSDTAFSPSDTCTRAQVVAFLWRAAGKPAPKSTKNPFKDVKKGAYYYDAVLWAVENGITSGVSETSFAPNDECTRAQVVAFLWRTAGKPAPKSTKNPFKDVKKGAYYYDAVLWAVEKGITSGVSATSFAPNDKCTRGQIVCFLHRYLG